MALFLADEGRDFHLQLEESKIWRLKFIQREGFTKELTIQNANDDHVCKACKELAGRKFLLEEEIKNPHLPCKECSSDIFDIGGFCRCSYVEIPNLDYFNY